MRPLPWQVLLRPEDKPAILGVAAFKASLPGTSGAEYPCRM